MSKLAKRLDAHFVACAAAAGAAVVGVAQTADAAIVHNVVNYPIASTTNGLYLNVVTGVRNEPGNGSGTTVPGWDVNPYSAAGLSYWNPAAPAGGVYVQRAGGGATGNLPAGTVIGAAPGGGRVYGNLTASTTGNDPHILNSSANIIGFRFQNELNGNAIHYGWFRVSLGGTLGGQPRVMVEYAYENVAGASIEAGAVPAPGSLALLALGAVGVAGRRRK